MSAVIANDGDRRTTRLPLRSQRSVRSPNWSPAYSPNPPPPPGAVGFEAAVRAVVGQQISVSGARTVLAKLCATDLFPTPEELLDLPLHPLALRPGGPGAGAGAHVARGQLVAIRGRRRGEADEIGEDDPQRGAREEFLHGAIP